MILKASQRAGAKQLAKHLLRLDENDHVEVHELRGFVAERLDDGMQLELGREQVKERLGKFVSAYPVTLGSLAQPVGYVDLRYPNGFAARMPEFKPKPFKPMQAARPKPAGNTNKPAAPKPQQPKPADKSAT